MFCARVHQDYFLPPQFEYLHYSKGVLDASTCSALIPARLAHCLSKFCHSYVYIVPLALWPIQSRACVRRPGHLIILSLICLYSTTGPLARTEPCMCEASWTPHCTLHPSLVPTVLEERSARREGAGVQGKPGEWQIWLAVGNKVFMPMMLPPSTPYTPSSRMSGAFRPETGAWWQAVTSHGLSNIVTWSNASVWWLSGCPNLT